MGTEINKSKVLSSLFWKLMERGGTQGIQFIVQIVLARLLLPEDFGVIALITIFITIANVFVQSGFNTALIQKKKATEEDFSSVFYLSLFISGFLYVVLFFAAPVIAAFYEQGQLIAVLRVLSITLFFGAFNSIQNAVEARGMHFKKLFISSLGAMVTSAAVGIAMAYAGFGVWALVGQQLTQQIAVTAILWYTVKWRPMLFFSFEKLKDLFSFGWKLLVSSLIEIIFQNLRSLFIGKMYSAATLGFYNRGQQFPQLIIANINGSIQSVMLPALSSYQDDRQKMKALVRRSIVTSSYLVFPIMIGLAVVAEPLVTILLTEKWLPAVPFLQIYCLSFALWPIHTANLQAINALGRSDIFLKLEIIKKIIGLVILGVSLLYGVYAIALGEVVGGVISSFINAYPNRKLLSYSYKEQWIDIVPSLLLSLVMGGIVYSIQWLEMSVLTTLIFQILAGMIIYIGMSKLFKLESFHYLVITMKQTIANRKQ